MDLRAQIIEAFADAPQPVAGNVSVPTYDDEDTAAYFTGKTWQGHSVQTLRWHETSLCFFTSAAFRYYLPAFMLAHIEDSKTADVIAEGILFNLTKGFRRAELLRELSNREKEAVALFFEDCAHRCGGYPFDELFGNAAEYVRPAKAG